MIQIESSVTGNSYQMNWRKNAKSYFWGEVINQNGNKVQAQFTTADGYGMQLVPLWLLNIS